MSESLLLRSKKKKKKKKKSNAKSITTCSVSIMLRKDSDNVTLLVQLLNRLISRLFH